MIRIIKIIALSLMLTLSAHAQDFNLKDIQCLARNIYFEAGSEPEEGKVAVGLVTINRATSPDYPNSICAVVHQKTVLTTPKEITRTRTVKEGWLGKSKQYTETTIIWTHSVVCQFSWACSKKAVPKYDDPRWIESQRVAEELAAGGYEDLREKYSNAMHFHAKFVHPKWGLRKVASIGGHIFYE